MNNVLSVMQSLAATSSRTEKEQIILAAFMQDCDRFFTGVRLALDPLITFGVAQVAEITSDDVSTGDLSFEEFIGLATALRRRELTGNRARTAIHAAAERCNVKLWNQFYRRILLKDLKVGVDAKTINKVMRKLTPAYPKAGSFVIPVFPCQLAEDGEHPAHQKKVRGRKLLDTKLDGVRILAVLDKEADAVDLFTRSGNVLDNFQATYAALRRLLAKLPGSVVLDGELISPNGFQHLMTLLRCKAEHEEMALVRYALFDILPLADFRAGHCDKSQRDRHAMLEAMQECGLWETTEGRVYVLPQIEVDLDTEAGQQEFADFNRRALDNGFEGIMLKDPDAPYHGKRTVAWLKRKPVIEVSLEVVGFEPGDPDSKYKDTLGALVGRGVDDGRPIQSKVAGGISDDLRHEIWANRPRYLGMIMEVTADRFTLEEGSATYSLRFPRLKGFRGRVPGEKL